MVETDLKNVWKVLDLSSFQVVEVEVAAAVVAFEDTENIAVVVAAFVVVADKRIVAMVAIEQN